MNRIKKDLRRLKTRGCMRDNFPIPEISEEEKQKHIHPRRLRDENKNVKRGVLSRGLGSG